jgi:hypothetical protein
MADSSTLATPSMTSTVARNELAASTRTTSPARSALAATVSSEPLRMRIAEVSARSGEALRLGLPAPSAIASAKFAKSTVNHNQKAT